MTRTATITWVRYHNFGSLLQAYALQKVILSLGYQNMILDDTQVLAPYEMPPKAWTKRMLKRILDKVYLLRFHKFLKAEAKSKRLAQKFKEIYLSIDTDTLPLEKVNSRYDCIICGSDQIWHPNNKNPFYYADFFKGKKIAYAPSIGVKEYPEVFYETFSKPHLDKFTHLSLREEKGAKSLSKLMHKDIPNVIDPTLLLERFDWMKLTLDNEMHRKPYVICYFLSPNKWYLDYAKQFAKEKGLDLRIFYTNAKYKKIGTPIITGPTGFLSEIKNSAWVLTDSFHATIFSIHFERQFITFQRFGELLDKNIDSRVLNLLEPLGLQERHIDRDNLSSIDGLTSIDYPSVKVKLQLCRENSIKYLLKALSE